MRAEELDELDCGEAICLHGVGAFASVGEDEDVGVYELGNCVSEVVVRPIFAAGKRGDAFNFLFRELLD